MTTRARERTLLDRALAAAPVAGLGLLVVSFYCIEAWTRKTPWLFTDEIEWTQISRAIAHTGHPAIHKEQIGGLRAHAQIEARKALRVIGHEIQKIPLRHQRDESAMHGQVLKIPDDQVLFSDLK